VLFNVRQKISTIIVPAIGNVLCINCNREKVQLSKSSCGYDFFSFSQSPIFWRRIRTGTGWRVRMLRVRIRLGTPEEEITESRTSFVAAQKVRKKLA
jgi:hypothetical protein